MAIEPRRWRSSTSLRQTIGKFIRNERGNTAIIVAVGCFVLFGMGAFAVDLGSFYYQKRRLQTANDLAAISAASDITHANAAALATLNANAFAMPPSPSAPASCRSMAGS